MAKSCCSSFLTNTPWTDCANLCIVNASPGFTGIGADGSIWIYVGGDVCDSGSWEVASIATLGAVERPFQIVGDPIEATTSTSVPNAAGIFHTGDVVIGDIAPTTNAKFSVIGSVAIGDIDHNAVLGANASILSGSTNEASGINSVAIGARNIASALSSLVSGEDNTVADELSAIIGGNNNSVTSIRSAILGGYDNSINSDRSTIIGGFNNLISGGFQNDSIINSLNSIISATGGYNTILGGRGNDITGAVVGNAYATGDDAHVIHSWAWVHATGQSFTSSAAYEVAMNALGGFRFFNDVTQVAGWTSPPGTVGIIATSSKSIKEDFVEVDVAGISKRFLNLELNKYKVKKPKFEDTHYNKIKDEKEKEEARKTYEALIYPQQYGIMAESFNTLFGDMFDVKSNEGYEALSVFDVLGVLSAAIKDLVLEIETLKKK